MRETNFYRIKLKKTYAKIQDKIRLSYIAIYHVNHIKIRMDQVRDIFQTY